MQGTLHEDLDSVTACISAKDPGSLVPCILCCSHLSSGEDYSLASFPFQPLACDCFSSSLSQHAV